jgi:hypothetical protein
MIYEIYSKIKSNYKEKMTDMITGNPDSESVKAIFGDFFMRQLTNHGLQDDDENDDEDGGQINSARPRASGISRRSKLKSNTSRSQTPSRSPDHFASDGRKARRSK